ncbi:MAG TPA: hypothetical protein VD713_05065, partial [Sphingomonadales bacterium]|nr:hypothetical protein [Sphingomonadales bacterium]
MNKAITILHDFLRALVTFSLKRAAIVAAASLALTAVSVWFTVTHLAIETNTDAMIDSSLPFRQTYEDFNRAFPQFSNNFTAVIDAPSPEAAEAAQGAFAAALEASGHHYKSVFAPGRGAFFEREGFLFLDTDKLLTLTDELAAAEPVLAAVSEDPSLRGLFAILNEGLDDVLSGEPPKEKLAAVLADFTKSAGAARQGRLDPLSWQAIFLDAEDLREAKRRLVVVQPALDYSALNAAKEPLLAARTKAREIEAAHSGV